MQPATTSPPPPAPAPVPVKRGSSFRTFVWIALLIALAFGLGYGPKEIERRKLASTLKQTELDLRLATLHRQLGMAAFEAQRNNFANSAANARVFFDGCRSVVNDYTFEDQPRTRLALQTYAGNSDVILGQLANADPAAKERLTSLFLTMDGLLERKQ